jgi:hypothetical protein
MLQPAQDDDDDDVESVSNERESKKALPRFAQHGTFVKMSFFARLPACFYQKNMYEQEKERESAGDGEAAVCCTAPARLATTFSPGHHFSHARCHQTSPNAKIFSFLFFYALHSLSLSRSPRIESCFMITEMCVCVSVPMKIDF